MNLINRRTIQSLWADASIKRLFFAFIISAIVHFFLIGKYHIQFPKFNHQSTSLEARLSPKIQNKKVVEKKAEEKKVEPSKTKKPIDKKPKVEKKVEPIAEDIAQLTLNHYNLKKLTLLKNPSP